MINYDYDYLKEYCKQNNITLNKDYSKDKITRETIIYAKCVYENCLEIAKERNFRQLCKTGCYCKSHTELFRREKTKKTSFEKFGVECPLQSKECRNKGKDTMLKLYGVENALQSEDIKDKVKQTCLEKFGGHPGKSEIIKKQKKQTCLKNYGVENPSQAQEIKDKKTTTCFKNYGVSCNLKLENTKEIIKQTNLEKYGVEYASQSEEVKNKMKQTCLINHGVEYSLQSTEVISKGKKTIREKYGVENPSQSEHIKEVKKQTSIINYGTEYPNQNAEFAEKNAKNAYKSKDYVFPSGRIERIQGYEHFMLDELLYKENVLEKDILVKRSEVPEIWYNINKKKRRYFVDCFIKSQNKCIEVKSTWTAEKKKEIIFLKQKAIKDAGYECEIWVYNGKGKKVNCYI
jgi:predicted nucleic acid-binding protein